MRHIFEGDYNLNDLVHNIYTCNMIYFWICHENNRIASNLVLDVDKEGEILLYYNTQSDSIQKISLINFCLSFVLSGKFWTTFVHHM